MSVDDKFDKFLSTITEIEKKRESDRQVDRLKKSSSATTFWAIIPGLFGIHGIAHFYLNRPIEGLVILFAGILPGILTSTIAFIPFIPFGMAGYFPSMNGFGFSPEALYWLTIALVALRLGFFIGNIWSARYQYSRYDFYIHIKAKRPWNNWGLDSKI